MALVSRIPFKGWIASIALTLGIVTAMPTATRALCNYGNCSVSYLCPENYCVYDEQLQAQYFDTSCGDPNNECDEYYCEFGTDFDGFCQYPGECGGDYIYQCA